MTSASDDAPVSLPLHLIFFRDLADVESQGPSQRSSCGPAERRSARTYRAAVAYTCDSTALAFRTRCFVLLLGSRRSRSSFPRVDVRAVIEECARPSDLRIMLLFFCSQIPRVDTCLPFPPLVLAIPGTSINEIAKYPSCGPATRCDRHSSGRFNQRHYQEKSQPGNAPSPAKRDVLIILSRV